MRNIAAASPRKRISLVKSPSTDAVKFRRLSGQSWRPNRKVLLGGVALTLLALLPLFFTALKDLGVVHWWAHAQDMVAGLFSSSASSPAADFRPLHCASSTSGGAFDPAIGSMLAMLDGPLVKALALMSFLMGGALAVAKSSPTPALLGIANAAALSYMPAILMGILGCGAAG